MKTSRMVAGAVGVFAAFAGFLLVAPGRISDRAVGTVDDLFFVALATAGVMSTGAAAAATRGLRRAAWTVMTVAMVVWLVGDVMWAYYDLRGLDPFPSPADVPYLSYTVLAAVALLLFPTRRSARAGARPVLDGIIVAGSLFIVASRTAMAQVYRAAGMSRTEELVSLAYPLTAVALLTVAAVVLVRSGAGQRMTLWLLTVGLAFSALSSGFFSYQSALSHYLSGNLLDLGWALSGLLIIAAATVDRNAVPHPADTGELVSWASVLMPYLPLMLAAAVVATTKGDGDLGGPVRVAALVVVGAVLVRQFLADRENRRLLNAVADQATHDPLTGLANRALFDDRLERLLRDGAPAAVVVIDLDGFKRVNDTFGHAAGDRVLVEVGRRLQEAVRHRDMVARIGGDEFAILIEGPNAHTGDVADRVERCFGPPFDLGGHTAAVRPSLGIAVAGFGADSGQTSSPPSAEDLLKRADLAMYAGRSLSRTPAPGSTRSS